MSVPPQPPPDPEHPSGDGPPDDDTPIAYSQTPYGHPGYAQDDPTQQIPLQRPYPQEQAYGYGYAAPPPPPSPPPKKRWPWVVGAVAVLAVAALIVALVVELVGGRDTADNAGAVTAPAPATGEASAPAAGTAPTTAAAPTPTADTGVLPASGIFKVGSDIQPGEYAVSPVGGTAGYWERLSCTTGEMQCIIANDNVSGPGYLTILPGDLAVRVERLRLVPTGAAPATAPPATTPPPVRGGDLPTDGQGFVGRASARCNSDDPAVVTARTGRSLVVICRTGVGRFYYKGVRLEDGAAIEIDDPVPSGSGFAATNDGVEYTISPGALVITQDATRLAEEKVLQYRAR
ncbi:hypothetical protein [Tomitella fengzijianii]|uniref:Protein kinase n=1 Tax=Tomitella fengzijianii TaxID=2597660 RepID=A0A516X0X8_9ACTN|nr:hypothetical protein [Tomitella fengzijianii]QDQ96732.1 hypothetical protein FO059_04450 [Tomitella fengzijianii]